MAQSAKKKIPKKAKGTIALENLFDLLKRRAAILTIRSDNTTVMSLVYDTEMPSDVLRIAFEQLLKQMIELVEGAGVAQEIYDAVAAEDAMLAMLDQTKGTEQ